MKVLLELLGDAAHALSKLDEIDDLRPDAREKLRSVLERIADESSARIDELAEAESCETREDGERDELLERALATLARERHQEAESMLRRGLEEHSSDIELLNHLGLACWEQGKLGAAEGAYGRAMEAGLKALERTGDNRCSHPSSEYLRAVEGRALCLYRLEQFDRAVTLFATLGSAAPDQYAGCYYLAGEIRHLQGRSEKAVDYYRRSPDEPSVHYNMGLALYDLGCHEEAARTMIRGFAGNPYIASLLLDRESGESAGPGGYLGSATYAEEFIAACSKLWKGQRGALRFLERCFEHPSVREFLRGDGAVSEGSPSDRGTKATSASNRRGENSEIDGIASDVVDRME